MALEVERKFTVRSDAWRTGVVRSARIRQGYLATSETASIRVRTADTGRAYLNIKEASAGVAREEFEYPIPEADAEKLLARLCSGPLVEKCRHWVPYGDHVWEVDEFSGDNAGLVVAEIELHEPEETFERPPWLGEEVTHELRYYNVSLARWPYRQWKR